MADELRDALDRLLENGLASYANTEPRPGLPQRVLNRIRSEAAPRRRFWLWWAVPVAAAACLAGGIVLWPHGERTPERPRPIQAAVSTPPPAVAAVEAPKPLRKSRRSAPAVARLPKREVFPTPTPLTAEERALMAFVRTAPPEALQPFSDKPAEIVPIRIERIEVQPLQISDDTQ